MHRESLPLPYAPARYRRFPSSPRLFPAHAQEQRSCVAFFAHRIPPRHVSLGTLGFQRGPFCNESIQYLANLTQLHGADFLDCLGFGLTIADVISLEMAGRDG